MQYQIGFETILNQRIRWHGAEGKGLCPFHADKNPSLSVNRETGKYYCHACNKGGGFRTLCKELGIPVPAGIPSNDDPSRQHMITPNSRKRPLRKTHQFDREYIYTDEDWSMLHLVAVNGTGNDKQVKQYHWDSDDWYTGAPARKVPYNLPGVIEAVESGEVVWITEGEKDAETLLRADWVATTNPNGAGSWPIDPDFNKVFEGADVVILPDNDEPGREHASKVAQILTPYAKRIRILYLPGLPDKGDVTDWVRAGGDTAALQTMAQEDGVDVKQMTTEAGSLSSTPRSASRSVVSPAALSSVGVAAPNSDRYVDARGAFRPVALAHDVREALPMAYFRGSFHVYEDGYYHPDSERKIRQYCQQALGDRSRSRYIQEVMEWLKNDRYLPDSTVAVPDDGLINVKNGLLNWRSGELLPHDPKRFCTLQIPVKYDPNASTQDVQKFVSSVVPSDVVPAVWQLFGYCLIPSPKYAAAFLLTGEGSNGKSTFISLLEAFVGEENVASATLRELENTRFSSSQLRDKLINSVADLEYTALEKSDMFKKITAGDTITAEFKGRDPFRFKPFAKFVLAANEPPASRDQTFAFFRRWRVFPFPYTFGNFPGAKKADPDLIERLKSPENLSGLLNLAIEGLRVLFAKDSFEETTSMKEAKENYRRTVDPVKGFFVECIRINSAHAEITKALYSAYEKWCEENGTKPYKKPRFFKHLQEHLPNPVRKRQHAGPEYYTGIMLKSESEWGMAPNVP